MFNYHDNGTQQMPNTVTESIYTVRSDQTLYISTADLTGALQGLYISPV